LHYANCMGSDIEKYPPPNDPTAFESLCLDLWQDILNGAAQKNGRRGQTQDGVDIFGRDLSGAWLGIQCKQKDQILWSKLTVRAIEEQVLAAKQFRPHLAKFILASTGPRDSKLQQRARVLTEKHKREGLFIVEVWSWDDIWHELYRRKELFTGIAESYWPRLALGVAEAYVSRLPATDNTLIGRDSELNQLEAAWDSHANFFQIVAPGGNGKTALITKWYKRRINEVPVFGWSFYRQGAAENSHVSSDEFLHAIVDWYHLKPKEVTPDAKVASVVRHLRKHSILLILDGLEPLQDPANGDFYDYPLKHLLRELAVQNAGIVLCTTRVRISDVTDDERVLSLDLDNLGEADGVRYLREKFGVQGSDNELGSAGRAYGNHALALTLLGAYLKRRGGDVGCRYEIDELPLTDTKPGRHARQVMKQYAKLFAGEPEGAILQGLGFFDRPAEHDALKLVLPEESLDESAISTLREARLILAADRLAPIDCHPLVREYFGSLTRADDQAGFRVGHSKLYEHFSSLPDLLLPRSLSEMEPLCRAVRHGCLAGRFEDALVSIYEKRIQHGEGNYYLLKTLGAFGTNQSLMTHFFAKRWSVPAGGLSQEQRAQVLGIVAFGLRALGQLVEALEPMTLGAQARVIEENWKSAAVTHNNLSELRLSLGDIDGAIAAGVSAVQYSDQFGDAFQRITNRSVLAASFHAAGNISEARRLFDEAETLQAETRPGQPILRGLAGFRFCDFLLAQGRLADVSSRSVRTLAWALERGELLAIGLHYILAGRVSGSDKAEANRCLNAAVTCLRKYGDLEYLCHALLARASTSDLAEVHQTATRAGMRLHLTDYHLAMAQREQDRAKAYGHLESAEQLIREIGYGRRRLQASQLRQQLD
jgi:hypothetical protein